MTRATYYRRTRCSVLTKYEREKNPRGGRYQPNQTFQIGRKRSKDGRQSRPTVPRNSSSTEVGTKRKKQLASDQFHTEQSPVTTDLSYRCRSANKSPLQLPWSCEPNLGSRSCVCDGHCCLRRCNLWTSTLVAVLTNGPLRNTYQEVHKERLN